MFFIDNKKLEPAPLVNISKQTIFNGDGSLLNSDFSISLRGTLLPNMGSPTSTGWITHTGSINKELTITDSEKFNAILQKQEYLKEIFSGTGYKVSYYPTSNTGSLIEFYPKLSSINFPPGNWVILSEYDIQLQTQRLDKKNSTNDDTLFNYGSGYRKYNLTSLSDSYTIRQREDGTEVYEVSRSLSATANAQFGSGVNNNAWENARNFIYEYIAVNEFLPPGFFSTAPTGLSSSGQFYNFVTEETSDQKAGSFSLTQKSIFNTRNYIETRTVSRAIEYNLLGDNGPNTTRITVDGNITGLGEDNTPSGKYERALAYWQSVSGSLGLLVGASGQPISINLNENRLVGTIDYNIQYINNDSSYKHTYDVSYTQSNENPTVSINGNIEGFTLDNRYTYSTGNKFNHALNAWNIISPSIKTLAFAYSFIPSGNLFANTPSSKTVSFNKTNGTINYNYVYSYAGSGNAGLNYINNYNINLNTDNSPSNMNRAGLLCTVDLNGQITGLQVSDDPNTKIINARSGWLSVRDTLFTLANNEYSLLGSGTPVLSSGVVKKVIGLDNRAGILSYNITYNNFSQPLSSGVAVATVVVEDTKPQDIFAIQIIPGRSSGPIIQNIATTNEKRRSINVSLTLYPKSTAPFYYDYTDKSIPENIAYSLATGVFPTGTRGVNWWIAGDSENWDYKAGFYTRSISIVY